MRKSILITIIVASIVVLAGTTAGVWVALTPSDDSELSVVSATADSETGTVSVVLTCEEDPAQTGTGQQNGQQRMYAYMHQVQIKNATSGEELYQQQYRWQYRNRVQNGQNFSYQYQVEGLEQGQMLQLRIEYNNGKVLTHSFQVSH